MPLKSRQSGAAMVLVMIVIATATITGMSYLASATVSLAAMSGYADSVRARQLAESGVQHAMCLLRENPDMLRNANGAALGPFAVDDTGEGYTFSVVQTVTAGDFEIVSTAVSGRSTQTVSAIVRHTESIGHVAIHAILSGGPASIIPASMKVSGPMHVNGSAFVLGEVTGDVSATSLVGGSGVIGGESHSSAAPVTVPTFNPDDYDSYIYGDLQGEAIQITADQIAAGHSIDDGDAVTIVNPAGVVVAKPINDILWLREGLDFRGTLVVHGDLVLDGSDMKLEALDGFPAAIVAGSVFITNLAQGVRIRGLVYASGGVYTYGDTSPSETTFEGGMICEAGGWPSTILGHHEIKYDSDYTTLMDPHGWGVGGVVDILQWTE